MHITFLNNHGKVDDKNSHSVFRIFSKYWQQSIVDSPGTFFSSRAFEWAYDGLCSRILNFRLYYLKESLTFGGRGGLKLKREPLSFVNVFLA